MRHDLVDIGLTVLSWVITLALVGLFVFAIAVPVGALG